MKSQQDQARSLKIQPTLQGNYWNQRVVPQLRLSGRWLEESGFVPNSRVRVKTESNRLIIEPEAPEVEKARIQYRKERDQLLDMARQMKRRRIDPELIAKATGLSKYRIVRLKM